MNSTRPLPTLSLNSHFQEDVTNGPELFNREKKILSLDIEGLHAEQAHYHEESRLMLPSELQNLSHSSQLWP
jgi:hypothetical protein